jgi:flagellar hook-associated protein 2
MGSSAILPTTTSTSGSNSPFTPLTINGVSQRSSDLQAILNRAVGIAQIPITNLQNKDTTILSQESALNGLQTAVGNLAASLTSLSTLAAGGGLSATSSDPTAVTATVTGATTPTSYTINSITSVATAASERTQISYADSTSTPVSSTGSLELAVGSKKYDFTATNNSLIGIRDQINSLNAGVTASILTTSGGNYLSLSANSTGATGLALIDDPVTPGHPGGANRDLLTDSNPGTDAVFQLNGIDLRQPGNSVNSVIPGVTLNLAGATNSPVTVSLASDPSRLSSAVQSFVTAYNAAHSTIASQEGTSGGALNGDPVITQLAGKLRQLASSSSVNGSVHTLADLGVTFNDATGQATFDGGAAINSLSGAQLSDAFKFAGSATGGLSAFSQSISQYSDPVTGLIRIEAQGFAQADQTLQSEITTKTDQLNAFQASLATRLQAADAALARLQAQQQTLNGSLQALSLVIFGQNPNQTP